MSRSRNGCMIRLLSLSLKKSELSPLCPLIQKRVLPGGCLWQRPLVRAGCLDDHWPWLKNRSPREQCVDGKSNLYSTSLHLDSVFCKARLCEGNRWSNPTQVCRRPVQSFSHVRLILKCCLIPLSFKSLRVLLPRSTRPAEARVISRGL